MTESVTGTGLRAYGRLLAYGPAARPFLSAVVARLPISMAPLGIIMLVEHERGSYGVAGLVTGAYAIGSAVGTPLWGRAMDRYGQRAVLALAATISSTLLVILAIATTLTTPMTALLVLAVGSGLTFPPVSPAIRAAWRTIFPDKHSRRVGFSLDATCVELMFVVGPLLLSALLAWSTPIVPLLVAAGMQAGGSYAYCLTEAARRARPVIPERSGAGRVVAVRRRGALGVPGLVLTLTTMLALSIGFGHLDTSMAAAAQQVLGSADKVGLLFTAIAGGSATGGLVFGSRQWRFDERRAVPVLFGAFALFLGLLSTILALHQAHPILVLPLLFITGLNIAPTLIMQQSLLDQITPAHQLNEAQAFLSASNTAGAACGTALAGLLIDAGGVQASLAVAAVAVAAACVVAVLSQPRWRASISAAALVPAAPRREPGPAHETCE